MKLPKKWADLGWKEDSFGKPQDCFKRIINEHTQQIVMYSSYIVHGHNKPRWRALQYNYRNPIPFIGDIHFATMDQAFEFLVKVAEGKTKWKVQ